mmetsp:Transcript_31473/g.86572  ORF Transcript_31473/g.86572 Transcript_31473/m.86572 type:complete len:317 (+) Transcript_31473:648-1598(+)
MESGQHWAKNDGVLANAQHPDDVRGAGPRELARRDRDPQSKVSCKVDANETAQLAGHGRRSACGPERKAQHRHAQVQDGHHNPPHDAGADESCVALRHKLRLAAVARDLQLGLSQKRGGDDEAELKQHRGHADAHPARRVAWQSGVRPDHGDLSPHEKDAEHRNRIHRCSRQLHYLHPERPRGPTSPNVIVLFIAEHVEHEVHAEVDDGKDKRTDNARAHGSLAPPLADGLGLSHGQHAPDSARESRVHDASGHSVDRAPASHEQLLLRRQLHRGFYSVQRCPPSGSNPLRDEECQRLHGERTSANTDLDLKPGRR